MEVLEVLNNICLDKIIDSDNNPTGKITNITNMEEIEIINNILHRVVTNNNNPLKDNTPLKDM